MTNPIYALLLDLLDQYGSDLLDAAQWAIDLAAWVLYS